MPNHWLYKLIEGGQVAETKIGCSSKADARKLFRFNLFGINDMAEK